MNKLKQLLANKNVVTILGALLIVIVLYGFYKWRLDSQMNPIRIPYAKVAIAPRTKITDDMIGYVDVAQSSLKGNVLTNTTPDIVGKYTNVNCEIPTGSFFYKDAVVDLKELPDSFLIDIPEKTVAYNYRVNVESTYGNSMYPGNYVDVYFKGDENGKVMVGKLVENVKILAVKDANGNPVFENNTEERMPAQIIFAVTDEIHIMLRQSEYIEDAELILVPINANYIVKDENEEIVPNVTSDYLKSYIQTKSVELD